MAVSYHSTCWANYMKLLLLYYQYNRVVLRGGPEGRVGFGMSISCVLTVFVLYL